MVIRIRFAKPAKKRPEAGKPGAAGGQHNRRMALVLASLMTPAALMAGVLGLWRIGADLKWTSGFAIPSGVFSHWQVWIAGGAALQLCSRVLNRYGRGGDAATS